MIQCLIPAFFGVLLDTVLKAIHAAVTALFRRFRAGLD